MTHAIWILAILLIIVSITVGVFLFVKAQIHVRLKAIEIEIGFGNRLDRQKSRKFNAEAKTFADEIRSRYASELIAKRGKVVRE